MRTFIVTCVLSCIVSTAVCQKKVRRNSKNEIVRFFDAEQWYYTTNLGFGSQLINNNQFSRSMHSPFSPDSDFSFSRFLDPDKKKSIGIAMGSYSYYNDEGTYETLIDHLNEFGAERYGEIVMNSWDEWQFGIILNYYAKLNEKWSLSMDIQPDLVFASRTRTRFQNENYDFVYVEVPKRETGYTLSADLGVDYRLGYKYKYDSFIGLKFGAVYGMYPAKYQVYYGNELKGTLNSYNFSDVFEIYRLRTVVTFNLSISDIKKIP